LARNALTAVQQKDFQLQRRLQQDSIELSGKTIYINPFLYWRRFDTNTDRWLREPGQIGEEQIQINRTRFYPEIDWSYLDEDEAAIKDAAVEMFLKSLELIGTFHPDLSAGQLLEIERKMAVTKKQAFERWVEKSFRKRFRQEFKEQKRIERERFWRALTEWLSNETTHQAVVPVVAAVILSGFVGWSFGVSNVSCPAAMNSNSENLVI
tara:strand:+ start:139 stop:765 length:627 start_codon:yes stop_codon:yes gene_type:complete